MPRFHWKDGWYFERITEPNPHRYGWLRITHIPQIQDADGIPDVKLEIEPHSWASIVASVSPEGETGFTFGLATDWHRAVWVFDPVSTRTSAATSAEPPQVYCLLCGLVREQP